MKTIKGIEFLGAPLYVLDPEDTGFDAAHLKEGTSCYVIGGNGMHTIERMKNQITIRRTTGCGLELADIKEGVSWVGKPIDANTISFLDGLFRAVFEKYSTEAVVLLYQDPSKGEWYVRVPEQTVTGGSAKWKDGESIWYKDGKKIDKVPEGLVMSGSAHSHGSMGAFFSGGDDADDSMTSGLHLVFGGYGKSKIVARVTGGGKKVDVETDKVILSGNPANCLKVEVPDLIKAGQASVSVRSSYLTEPWDGVRGGNCSFRPGKPAWVSGPPCADAWDKAAQRGFEKSLCTSAPDDHAPDPIKNPNGDDDVFAAWDMYEPDCFDNMSDEDLIAYGKYLDEKQDTLASEMEDAQERFDVILQLQIDRGIDEDGEEAFQ